MERLTERDKTGTAMAVCCGSECKYNYCCEIGGFSECGGMDSIIDRLAAYEETGLEPEEIISATDMAKIACALHELNAYKELGPIDHLKARMKGLEK